MTKSSGIMHDEIKWDHPQESNADPSMENGTNSTEKKQELGRKGRRPNVQVHIQNDTAPKTIQMTTMESTQVSTRLNETSTSAVRTQQKGR